jgi:hypothetical protein
MVRENALLTAHVRVTDPPCSTVASDSDIWTGAPEVEANAGDALILNTVPHPS